MPTFEEKHKMRSFMIAPTCLIRGLGMSLEMDIVDAPGATGDYHTDLQSKARTGRCGGQLGAGGRGRREEKEGKRREWKGGEDGKEGRRGGGAGRGGSEILLKHVRSSGNV